MTDRELAMNPQCACGHLLDKHVLGPAVWVCMGIIFEYDMPGDTPEVVDEHPCECKFFDGVSVMSMSLDEMATEIEYQVVDHSMGQEPPEPQGPTQESEFFREVAQTLRLLHWYLIEARWDLAGEHHNREIAQAEYEASREQYR